MAFTAPPAREVAPGVHQFDRFDSAGWNVSMIVVRLAGGGTLVYSPTWIGDDTFERVQAVGRPSALMAPNHFHNLSLRRFRERYPEAQVLAGAGALKRLAKRGHGGAVPVAEAGKVLPPGAAFLEPEGLKNGEVWITIDDPAGGGPTWIVCDAFMNMSLPVRGFTGLLLRWMKIVPGFRIGKPFGWVGIRDSAVYRAWALAAIDARRPRRLVFCHGEPIDDPALPDRMREVVAARFPAP